MILGYGWWFQSFGIICLYALVPTAVVLGILVSKSINERNERLAVIELLDRSK